MVSSKDDEPLDVIEVLLGRCTESLVNAKVQLELLRSENSHLKELLETSESNAPSAEFGAISDEDIESGQIVYSLTRDAGADGAWAQPQADDIGKSQRDTSAQKHDAPEEKGCEQQHGCGLDEDSLEAILPVGATFSMLGVVNEDDNNLAGQAFLRSVSDCATTASFELLHVWHETAERLSSNTNGLQRGKSSRRAQVTKIFSESQAGKGHVDLLKGNAGEAVSESRHPTLSKYILRPDGSFRLVWDMFGLFLVGYDVLALPVQLLDPPQSLFYLFMSWMTRLFWTADFFLSFVSGYVDKTGTIQLHPLQIARHYLTTWFALDLAIVSLDWLDLLLDDTSVDLASARLGKATRFVRVIRLLRVARVFRGMDAAMALAERFQLVPERLKLLGEIMKTMSVVLIMAHFTACLWYGIGDASRDDELGYWFQSRPNLERDFYLRYTVSLHWSLSQFQGGMDEFVPHNLAERLFTVCVTILAFCVSAAVLSRLTSLSTQLYILSQQESEQFAMLRSFLKQNSISMGLSARINRSVRFKLKTRKTIVQVSQVELLDWMSKGLRVEMDFEIFSRVLCYHRFFDRYAEEYPGAMKTICNEAASVSWVSIGDVLFSQGERPSKPRLHVLQQGVLSYTHVQGNITRIDNEEGENFTDPRTFVCEPVLWTTWTHCGALTAETYSMMTEIDAGKFQDVASHFEVADFNVRKYARAYLELLNTRPVISDLALSLTEEENDLLNESLINDFPDTRMTPLR
eukprot:TRINITY_DN18904_c0_g1_i1.p1 TRINITY_DN18904_c0_g1~~TRINITY_DN18904_c0_g1_i1.p1  ORF type:complete len:762 (-),score=102.49 TRINITY_DN18904_c0_g1_i1:45-2282(-)